MSVGEKRAQLRYMGNLSATLIWINPTILAVRSLPIQEQCAFKYLYFNVRLTFLDCLTSFWNWDFDVHLKGFGGTVYCNTANIKCTEFTMYLLSFFEEIKKRVFIKFSLQCKNPFFFKLCSRTFSRSFSGELKIWTANKETHIYGDHVRFDYFSLL